MTRVLVTGGAGYLGSILCGRLLEAGCRVTALDNLMYGQHTLFHLCANPGFSFVFGDARDESLIRTQIASADVIIPLAAVVGAPACDRDPLSAESVNLGAIRLVNRLRSPNQLLVFPTTNSGYGTKSGETYCTEETPLEPISLYARTKACAEAEVLACDGTIALRLATVFGMSPRMRLDLLVNHFVYAAATDKYLVLFEEHFKRNYVHIRDVADCFHHAITNAEAMMGRTYNVGLDNANLSKGELARTIQRHVPELVVHVAPIGSDPDQRNYIVSNQRLREAGFVASRTLDEGIVELLKGYATMGRRPYHNG
jgi:nucleoside-diphosphate-sugar epimerase